MDFSYELLLFFIPIKFLIVWQFFENLHLSMLIGYHGFENCYFPWIISDKTYEN